jgi:2-succinyl-6-hydroxy-2,4-cyclohexadiene-1-carboxylate synthase
VGSVLVHGFTQSERSWDRFGLDDAIALPVPDGLDFVATAAALGGQGGQARYVGYSMGGRLCLQLALDRPELVERLVLVSASPGIADPAERAVRCASDEALAREVERDGVDAFLERWLAQPMFSTLPAAAAGIDERRAVNTVGRLAHQLRALGQGAQPSNWARLRELRMPVLLITGDLDRKYGEIARNMVAAIGDVEHRELIDAGHACHLEHPDAFVHVVESW